MTNGQSEEAEKIRTLLSDRIGREGSTLRFPREPSS